MSRQERYVSKPARTSMNWAEENTPYSRGHVYKLINVFECFSNPKYIHLAPQIEDSGQIALAAPRLKHATKILDYIVENIEKKIDPKKKFLRTDQVTNIIHTEHTRMRAEDEAKKPPPTKEEEELRDLVMHT